VPTHLHAPFALTFESLGEVATNDVVDADDLHAVSRLRSECFLNSSDFGGASGPEDRYRPSSVRGRNAAQQRDPPPDTITIFEKLVYNMRS